MDELLLEDDGGVFELRGRKIHAEKLWMFVMNLSDKLESVDEGEAQ